MEQIFSLFVMALLGSIIIATYIVIEFIALAWKKQLTNIQKKIVTGFIGIGLILIWFKIVPDMKMDLLILTFLAAVGFYDYFIKTVTEHFKK